jgi:hypothetical protein
MNMENFGSQQKATIERVCIRVFEWWRALVVEIMDEKGEQAAMSSSFD